LNRRWETGLHAPIRNMKPLGSFRPEPPPPLPKAEWRATIAALLTVMLGIGVPLYCFHDAGTIGKEAALAIMVFVLAVAAGTFITPDAERRAHRDAPTRFEEVSPPFDVYLIWPPESGWIAETPSVRRDARRKSNMACKPYPRR
jgi:hypothetical protein